MQGANFVVGTYDHLQASSIVSQETARATGTDGDAARTFAPACTNQMQTESTADQMTGEQAKPDSTKSIAVTPRSGKREGRL
jgi:hypothetical protein